MFGRRLRRPGRRGGLIGCALALSLALPACGPATSDPSPHPSSAPAPTASVDFTAPGRAAAVLEQLIAAAGSAHAIKVELDATSATLSVVIGQRAETWAWRDGVVQLVESDTAYVGQTIFDPRLFDLFDLGRLFRQAAALAQAAKSQSLHIVEYADGQVYMTVTTNPESTPVFFRADGSIVDHLDLTTVAGLTEGLADVVGQHRSVLAVGLDLASGGVYADRAGRPGQIIRTLRMPRLPARQIELQESVDWPAFDPAVVRPEAIVRVIDQLEATTQLSWVVDGQGLSGRPGMRFSLGGRTIRATLNGTVLPN